LNKFWSGQFEATVMAFEISKKLNTSFEFCEYYLMITIKSSVLFIFNQKSHRNKTTLKYSGIKDNGIKLTLIDK
jgi:hypothetical protein